MSEENTTTKNNVDEAIRRAQEQVRQQMKSAEGGPEETTSTPKTKLSDSERKAQKEKAEQERAEKKAARDAAREQKKAERAKVLEEKKRAREAKKAAKALERQQKQVDRGPAHMAKVLRAAEELPELSEDLDEAFCELMDRFEISDRCLLIAHLQLANRMQQTEASNSVSFEEGQQVRIVASEHDATLIGKVGTVTEMRKIRVLLDVEGVSKAVYLFTADCEPLQQEQVPTADGEDITEDDVVGTEVSEDGFLTVGEADDSSEDEATGTEG